MSNLYNEISTALQRGKQNDVKELVTRAIEEKLPVTEILDQGLLAGMDIISEQFKNNEVYVPEVLVAARAMNAGAALLKPLLEEAGAVSHGRVLIGTVKGDLHDIGKNLVRLMLEGKGLEVVDLGVDVSAEQFLAAHREQKADAIALSALLTTTMQEMKGIIDTFKEAGLREEVIFLVGGAPISESFKDTIGADIYTPDAASAAQACKAAILAKKG
ncbi:MAG: cobalamin-dependent protein [Defluviitaleaceae bacterium]|nr:cobalamin-dependent protein [Defluviitaleaceae bacterium]MCL2239741.1 cobalamin-dependent protein [Defluviitaleaceae bacterium]